MRTIHKITIILLAFVSMQVATAQTDSTKTEVPKAHNSHLPQKGNFAIGANVTPVFNFVGNIFNGTIDNEFEIASPLIYAKYYLTDNTALRSVLYVNSGSDKQLSYAQDDAALMSNPLSNAQVTDMKTDKVNEYYLSVGLQKFIGENRLRGFYGAQLFGQYSKEKSEYAYGNPMTGLNPLPTSSIPAAFIGVERKLSEVNTNDFMVGAGGIAGFEYYIAPRLCIGGEVSLNFVYTQNLQTYRKSEKVASNKVVAVDKALTAGGHEFNFQTLSFTPDTFHNIGLYVMLHF